MHHIVDTGEDRHIHMVASENLRRLINEDVPF